MSDNCMFYTNFMFLIFLLTVFRIQIWTAQPFLLWIFQYFDLENPVKQENAYSFWQTMQTHSDCSFKAVWSGSEVLTVKQVCPIIYG